MKPLRIAIVGTGLIGASLGAAGKSQGVFATVTGIGRSAANLKAARDLGAADRTTTDLHDGVADADLVVLAAPVRTSLALLGEVAEAAPKALITDVGSVKEPIGRRAAQLGLDSRFVGAHPMAGKAESGASAADPALFQGCKVVVVPGASAPTATVHAIWEAVGAEVVVLDAATHDAAVATASHLPQFLAYALAGEAGAAPDAADVARLAATGFADMTRLATSDPTMWIDIAMANRDALLRAGRNFGERWEEILQALENGDERALGRLIDAAQGKSS